MKKAETLFIGVLLMAVIIITAGGIWYHNAHNLPNNHIYPDSKYGAFLAAQHAIYVNDFKNASKFSEMLTDTDYPVVQSTKFLSQFLSGEMPEQAIILEEEKNAASRLIYDAYLVQKDDWDALYQRHKKDESALAAPLRVWASVAVDKEKDALKFIKNLPTNDSWKNFISGQIYAEKGDIKKATESFSNVRVDFMNINDYLYLMSFYNHNNLMDSAHKLHDEFTARPGGMYMLDYDNVPDWSMFSGLKNELAFSLIQTVSHTQIMMYSDLSILLLRFAQITSPDIGKKSDAINYYLGQFFYNNVGNYAEYFNNIKTDSPFYLFAVLRQAEKSGDIKLLEKATKENPLFVPAINKLIAYNIQQGNRRSALRVINMALEDEKLTDLGKAFFLKSRAHIYYMFGDIKKAQDDLHEAAKTLPLDGEILALQAKIWASEGREIENAYDYAMTLVKQDPTDILAWDTLARVITVREGVEPAIEVLARVGEISVSCSSLFEQLGDLYVAIGDKKLARDAYLRAIELSDDGLVIVPKIQEKLREVK